MNEYEYKVEHHSFLHGGGTSGHDQTSLELLLNVRATEGWRFIQMTKLQDGKSMLIFERTH